MVKSFHHGGSQFLMLMLITALGSCVRKPLEVVDTSALQAVTISVDNPSETWDIGTVRTFVLGCEPSEAKVSGYDLISRKNGIFDRATADSFRRNILSRGGSEDAAVLYRNFMGRDPQPEALMEKLGLTDATFRADVRSDM